MWVFENKREQEVLAVARQLRAGGESYRDVATILKRRGKTNRAGRKFDHRNLNRLLQMDPPPMVIPDAERWKR